MFNLLKNLTTQKSGSPNSGIGQSIPYSNSYESPTPGYSYEGASFSEANNTAIPADNFYETYQSKNRSMRNQEWLDSLKSITRDQIGDFRFSVEMLASEMALSRSQLFRRVKELLGVSPNQFIRDIRLEVAKELLENGRMSSVKATAYEVGLKDIAHFSKMFKEKFGFLPSDYI